jgi:biopolymer transport protein TolR
MSQINVVPYIDVMLVLLIIFMVTAPLLQLGVEINLPTAENPPSLAPADKEKLPIIVGVDSGGTYYLAIEGEVPQQQDDIQALEALIAERLERDPEQQVYVEGDNAVNYGKVAQLLLSLQSAGAKNVGFMMGPTEKTQEER